MKLLYVLNVARFVNNFSHTSMLAAKLLGMEFHIAGNWGYPTVEERQADEIKYGIAIHQIDFFRHPCHPQNLKAYKQLLLLVRKEKFDVIHCNTPIAGVLGRAVGQKCHTPNIIYQAHGFHFYKGAPLRNWLFYYPMEVLFSYFTNVIITINQEDQALAKRNLHAGKIHYVPGIGVDLDSFSPEPVNHSDIRLSLSIPENACLCLSIGELNRNKNHQTILYAIAQLKDVNLHYCIVGTGSGQKELLTKIVTLGLEGQVHLLGYRSDVQHLYNAADIYCHPSYREGLSVSLMEAMAMSLPCVVSNIRGNVDLVQHGEGGYLLPPTDVNGFAAAISKLSTDVVLRKKMGAHNRQAIQRFDTKSVTVEMSKIYAACINK